MLPAQFPTCSDCNQVNLPAFSATIYLTSAKVGIVPPYAIKKSNVAYQPILPGLISYKLDGKVLSYPPSTFTMILNSTSPKTSY